MVKTKIAFKRIELVVRGYFEDLYSREDDTALKVRYRKNIENIRIYEQWAIAELLNYIKNSDERVLDAVELFRSKMDEYSCKNTSNSYIFIIAYDTATCALDALIYAGYH